MGIAKPALVLATEFVLITCLTILMIKPAWAQTSQSTNSTSDKQALSSPYAGENPETVVVIGEIKNESKLESSDIDRLKNEIATTMGTTPGSKAEAIIGKPDSSKGEYVVTGSVSIFAGAYIVKLELRNIESKELINSVESKPLIGAAELLSGTRDLANSLLESSPFYGEPNQIRKEPTPQALEKAPERTSQGSDGFHTVTYEVNAPQSSSSSSVTPNSSSRPGTQDTSGKPRSGARVAAHVFFWLGFDSVVGGAILLGTGANEANGAVFLGMGGVFIVIGLICATTYHSKLNAWKRGKKLGMISPVVTPDYGGLNYSFRF